jgi:drug/metabolite transporter (DMT)-like permease
MGTSPIFVLLLAYIFVPDEQIGPRRIAGVILGFVGLLVLILPEVLAGQASGGNVVAKIACVAAALCYSVGAILIRRAPPIPPIALTAGMLTAGTIALTPIALYRKDCQRSPVSGRHGRCSTPVYSLLAWPFCCASC